MTTEYLNRVKNFVKWLVPFVLAIFLLFGCSSAGETSVSEQPSVSIQETEAFSAEQAAVWTEQEPAEEAGQSAVPAEEKISEDGAYTGKDEVALYIHTFGKLPRNFITKKQAEKLGWVSKEANLWEAAPGMSIGGSHYGNYEELLPDKEGRRWTECDINFDGGYRGAERIIYSSDGLIYYTGDHYKTFEQLY